jgi:hypothetical protein
MLTLVLLYVHVRAFYLSEHSFCEHPARGHKRNCSRLKACHCALALGWRSSLFSSHSRATSWRRRESSRRSPPSSPSLPPSLPVLKIGGNELQGTSRPAPAQLKLRAFACGSPAGRGVLSVLCCAVGPCATHQLKNVIIIVMYR